MTSWVRLWHDMPTDPKFRTIARAAKQPLPTVVAVFTYLLTNASANRWQIGASNEDIAEAFDIAPADVTAILSAMQGRILDGQKFTDWARQSRYCGDRVRPDAHIWRALRDFVFRRDDFTCQYCGTRATKLECDHVVPVSRGGDSELENLKTACFDCNRSKRDKLLSEWKP